MRSRLGFDVARLLIAAALCAAALVAGCAREEATEGEPVATADEGAPPADGGEPQARRARQRPVFFKVGFPTEAEGTFVIRLNDPAKIQAARDAIRDPASHPHSVLGTIAKRKARYNPDWSFQLLPRSIELFEQATEVCDAAPQEVEKNLNDACGSFLPDCRWCPWQSKVLAEIPRP